MWMHNLRGFDCWSSCLILIHNGVCKVRPQNFEKTSPLLFTTVHKVKSNGKISQNFVAFSGYMNFNIVRFSNLKWVWNFCKFCEWSPAPKLYTSRICRESKFKKIRMLLQKIFLTIMATINVHGALFNLVFLNAKRSMFDKKEGWCRGCMLGS